MFRKNWSIYLKVIGRSRPTYPHEQKTKKIDNGREVTLMREYTSCEYPNMLVIYCRCIYSLGSVTNVMVAVVIVS
jgi:hypothetical protein